MNGKNTRRGFTLIELLVVVVIIGILAAIALPQYQKAVDRSRLAGVWNQLASLREALAVAQMTPEIPEVNYRSSWHPDYLDIGFSCGDMSSSSICVIQCPSNHWRNCAYIINSDHYIYDVGTNAKTGAEGKAVVWWRGTYNGSDMYLRLDDKGQKCIDSNSGVTCKKLGQEP